MGSVNVPAVILTLSLSKGKNLEGGRRGTWLYSMALPVVLAAGLLIQAPLATSTTNPAHLGADDGAAPVSVNPGETTAVGGGPRLVSPEDHAAMPVMGNVEMAWAPFDGAQGTQRLQIVPTNGDAPGLDLYVTGGRYTFAAPEAGSGPYQMLPGAVYGWRVQNAQGFPGAWSDTRTFSTPRVTASSISAGESPAGLTPAIAWKDSTPQVFWYEVQLSQDAGFPATPSAGNKAVFSNRVHAGLSQPLMSWRVPESSALEPEHKYFWRVRPVVLAEPAAWSQIFSFDTPAVPVAEPEPEDVGQAPSPARTAASRPVPAGTGWGARPTLPAAAPAVVSQDGVLGQVLSLINQIRVSNGLVALSSNGTLAAAAQVHSNDMAGMNTMSHSGSDGSSPSQRISAAGYSWRVYGEIVAAGQPNAQAVVNAWMNSPSHREVILTPSLREFGAGLTNGAGGRPYWTVDFGTR